MKLLLSAKMQLRGYATAIDSITADFRFSFRPLNQRPGFRSYFRNHVSCSIRQVILTVPDEQFAPLMEVLKALPFDIKIRVAAPSKIQNPALSQTTTP